MLEGLVAAGFYSCFYGNGRRAVLAGAGAAGLAAVGFLFPEIRFVIPVLTALWLMLAGALFQTRRREELLLSGGSWLLARSLSEIAAGGMIGSAAGQTGVGAEGIVGQAGAVAESIAWQATVLQPGLRQRESLSAGFLQAGILPVQGAWFSQFRFWWDGQLLVGSLQVVIAAAFFGMVVLYLLGRGRLYSLWLAVLAIMWPLAGFLGGIPYTEPWQGQVMAVSLYAVFGGILAFQQITCVRQELERAKWGGRAAGYGTPESRFAETFRRLWAGRHRRKAETAETTAKAPGKYPGFGETENGGEEEKRETERRGAGADWREAARQEYQRLQIFEHDFRHHLDVIAALYEEGSPQEAYAYMEDVKQARVSRQGRKIGGERELSYIMLAKREACRQAQIAFSYQIVGSPRGIAQMDMAALLLNLLDNAIRACMEVPHSRSIGVMLLSRGELWEIEMVNSGRYEPGKAEKEQAARQMSFGRKVHGIGLASVRQIVEKYQGTYQVWQEAGQVRQKLILVQCGAWEALSEPVNTG